VQGGRTPVHDVHDDVVERSYQSKQRSSPPGRQEGTTTYRYQNGFGGGGVGGYPDDDDPDVRGRRGTTEAPRPMMSGGMGGDEQRGAADREIRYRSTQDERADTPQSGRLSQAAMMVREMYEDGEFDQDIAVTRGLHSFVLFWPPERLQLWRRGCLSVCVSVSLMYCVQTTESIIMRPSPGCSPVISPIKYELHSSRGSPH